MRGPRDLLWGPRAQGGAVLEIRNLQKVFLNGHVALRDLSFEVPAGGFVGILGTSGCGKSTLLRILCGLDQATVGEVLLDGQLVRGIDPRVNLVFQEPRLLPWKTVWENVAFGLPSDLPPQEGKRRVEDALKVVGLSGHAGLLPKHLSGGMAQRVSLARALVRTPEVLLLDEPFSALDAFTRMQLQDLLVDLHARSRATVVLVTHDIDEALYLCDRLLILRGQPGRLIHRLEVDEPRPRHRGSPWLARLKETILEWLDLSRPQEEAYALGGGI